MKRLLFNFAGKGPLKYPGKVFVSAPVPFKLKNQSLQTEIKIIGILHGHPPLTPVGIKTGRILKKELKKEKGLVLVEGKRGVLPRNFLESAKELEPIRDTVSKVIFARIGTKGVLSLLHLGMTNAIETYAGELFHKVERIEGTAARLVLPSKIEQDPGTIKFARKLGVTPKELVSGMRLLLTVESLFMAAEAIKQIEKAQASSAKIVVGRDHMQEIQKFLQNPRLATRYIDYISPKIPLQDNNARELLYEISEAKKVFEKYTQKRGK